MGSMSYDDWKLSTPPEYEEREPLTGHVAISLPPRRPSRSPKGFEAFDWTPAAQKTTSKENNE